MRSGISGYLLSSCEGARSGLPSFFWLRKSVKWSWRVSFGCFINIQWCNTIPEYRVHHWLRSPYLTNEKCWVSLPILAWCRWTKDTVNKVSTIYTLACLGRAWVELWDLSQILIWIERLFTPAEAWLGLVVMVWKLSTHLTSLVVCSRVSLCTRHCSYHSLVTCISLSLGAWSDWQYWGHWWGGGGDGGGGWHSRSGI